VDSWADWCGPGHTIAPVLGDLAAASEDRVTPGKVNVVENPGLATRYGIRSLPTILFVKEGPVGDPLVGAVPKTVLRRHLDRASLVS
jgi:thioredoxin 1